MLQKPPVTLSGGFSFYIPYTILVNIKLFIGTDYVFNFSVKSLIAWITSLTFFSSFISFLA